MPLPSRGGRYYQEIIDSRYIVIFQSIGKLSTSKKIYLGIIKNYRYRKMRIQFHMMNSIESTVLKTGKKVFHIQYKYEMVGRVTIYSYFFVMKMITALVFMTSWWDEVENSMSGPRRLMQDPASMRIHPTTTTDTTPDLHR